MNIKVEIWSQILVVIVSDVPSGNSAKVIKVKFDTDIVSTLHTIRKNKPIIMLGKFNG